MLIQIPQLTVAVYRIFNKRSRFPWFVRCYLRERKSLPIQPRLEEYISAAYKIMKNKFDSKISIFFYGMARRFANTCLLLTFPRKQIWWNHLIYSPRIQFWEEHYRRHRNIILKRARTSKTSMPFSRFCCNTMFIDLIVGVIRFVIITIDDIEGFLP